MSRAERDAVAAGVRLGVVVVGLLAFAIWWLLQRAPDYRVDQRIRLAPERAAAAAEPARLGGVAREAWTVPRDESLRFAVVVPEAPAALRLLAGSAEGQADLMVRLERRDGLREDLLRQSLPVDGWQELRIELPVDAGEAIDLELAVPGGPRGARAALVADVVLESPGREVDESEIPVSAPAVQGDLLAALSFDRGRAPPTPVSARVGMPGPLCLLLHPDVPQVLSLDTIPAGASLHTVLHVAPLPESRTPGTAQVHLFVDDEAVGDIAVDPSLTAQGEPQELLSVVDLAPWVGRSVPLRIEARGGRGLFLGVRELLLVAPQQRERRRFEPDTSRNVLLVAVDGLRADRLGAWGYERGSTPRLDELARRGLRYERVMAPSGWALPNLATLLTGTSPVVHGLGEGPGRVLSARVATLAQEASWAGFTTAAFTTSPLMGASTGLDRGQELHVHCGLGARALVDQAVDWLDEASQFEWFLTLHLGDATWPHDPAPDDLARVAAEPDPLLVERLRRLDPRPGSAEALALEQGPRHDAELAGVDAAVGRLIDALAARDLLRSTLVVVVSTHGLDLAQRDTPGPSLFDEVVTLPVILAGPGVPAPAVVERSLLPLSEVSRLVATLGGVTTTAATDLELPPPFGVADPERAVHARLVPFPDVTRARLEATRRGGWLVLRDLVEESTAVFDLRTDPGATLDLWPAEEARAKGTRLGELFEDWFRNEVLESAARAVPLRR